MSKLLFDLQKIVIFYLDITEYTKKERNELLITVFEIKQDKLYNVIYDWYYKDSKRTMKKGLVYSFTTYNTLHYVNGQFMYSTQINRGHSKTLFVRNDIVPTNIYPNTSTNTSTNTNTSLTKEDLQNHFY